MSFADKPKASTAPESIRPSRRAFLKNAGIGLSGLGLNPILFQSLSSATAAQQSDPRSAPADETTSPRRSQPPVIDVHRHCIPETSTLVEGVTRSIAEMLMGLRETDGYSSATVDGITSVIYPEMNQMDLQMKGQDEAGVTLGLLSFSMGLESLCRALFFVPDAEVTRQFNDATAKMVQPYPGRAAFMVGVNPFDESSIAECERCFQVHDAKGIAIGTSWNGKFLDAQEAEPFWEYVQEKDRPIFVHPPLVPIGYQKMDTYRLEEMVGRPFETTMTVARMIYSGVFDRHPGLRVVLPHMGAALPNIAGRLDFGYRLGYGGLPEGQAAVCRKKPSEYFRTNLYVDTMGFNPLGIKYTIETFGIDHVLFGSDYAAVPISPREHIDMVKSLGLSAEDEDKIFFRNAERMFGLSL